MSSILEDVKAVVMVGSDPGPFDTAITMHINTAFSTLGQLGVGPELGFRIENAEATWEQFLGESLIMEDVKSYVTLRVRQLFDPPQTAHLLAAMTEQVRELEWRINEKREQTQWVDPTPPVVVLEGVVIDGGTA